jgi:hypothetical protein
MILRSRSLSEVKMPRAINDVAVDADLLANAREMSESTEDID